jgi:hypothetical protein
MVSHNPRSASYRSRPRKPRAHDAPDVEALMNGTTTAKPPPIVSRETKASPQTAREGAGDDVGSAGSAAAFARPDPRGEVRPEMRASEAPHEMTSRERAERRTAEIMGHLDENLDEGVDELFIEDAMVPDGWTYEWKRQTVYGKSDPAYDTKLARTGWETVPATRHPAMMPKGSRGEITRDGLVLMERPKAITDRVKQIMYRKAKGAVALKEQQLNDNPEGTFARVDESGRPTARVRVSHSPVEIPVPTE